MAKTKFLTIKLPSEIRQEVRCELCNKIMKDNLGLIVLNDANKVIRGMCVNCNDNLKVEK